MGLIPTIYWIENCFNAMKKNGENKGSQMGQTAIFLLHLSFLTQIFCKRRLPKRPEGHQRVQQHLHCLRGKVHQLSCPDKTGLQSQSDFCRSGITVRKLGSRVF